MKKQRVIIAGSEGIIGKQLSAYFSKDYRVYKLSRRFGHDLTDELFVKNWFLKHKAEYLVNCYGMSDPVTKADKRTTLFNISLASVEEYLKVNAVSVFSVCREFAKSKTSKAIVNFSSIYGIVSPLPALYEKGEKHIGYGMSKAAVIQLTRHLAVHLAPRVRVNCIAPGGIEHKQSRLFKAKYAKHTPMGRMMKKNELNGLVKFLCSDESSYVTGSLIAADGGWTAN